MRIALSIRLAVIVGFAVFVGIQDMWFLVAVAVFLAALTIWQMSALNRQK